MSRLTVASTPWQRPLLNRELADLRGDDWALIEDQLLRYQHEIEAGKPFGTVERKAAAEALEALARLKAKAS